MNQIPCLKELSLDVTDPNATRRITNAASLFQQLVAHNTSLEFFDFTMDFDENEMDAEAKATFKDNCREEWNQSLEVAMESNDTLQEVTLAVLDFQEIPLCDNVMFWIWLNRIERKKLTANLDDRKLWLDVIIDQRKTPKITYHLLSMNLPVWLISPPSKPPTVVANTKRGNRDVVNVEKSKNRFKKRKN